MEKIFLTFMMPIGLMYLILVIPGFVADEAAHMYRVYDVQMGNIISPVDTEGVTIPKVLDINQREYIDSYKEIFEKVNEKTDYNDTKKNMVPCSRI